MPPRDWSVEMMDLPVGAHSCKMEWLKRRLFRRQRDFVRAAPCYDRIGFDGCGGLCLRAPDRIVRITTRCLGTLDDGVLLPRTRLASYRHHPGRPCVLV